MVGDQSNFFRRGFYCCGDLCVIRPTLPTRHSTHLGCAPLIPSMQKVDTLRNTDRTIQNIVPGRADIIDLILPMEIRYLRKLRKLLYIRPLVPGKRCVDPYGERLERSGAAPAGPWLACTRSSTPYLIIIEIPKPFYAFSPFKSAFCPKCPGCLEVVCILRYV